MIIKMLDEYGQVNVNELSRYFNVSEVTIRNDLAYLERKTYLLEPGEVPSRQRRPPWIFVFWKRRARM